MRSPKPPSFLESARASLAASDSASTIHSGIVGVGLSPSGHRFPEQSGGLFPQDGSLPFDLSVIYLKTPSCLESARASLTASDSARANTGHGGSVGGGVSLNGRRVPEQSWGLLPQYGSFPFESSVISPNPPSFSDRSHASLTTSASASASTSHCDSSGGGVSPSGHRVP